MVKLDRLDFEGLREGTGEMERLVEETMSVEDLKRVNSWARDVEFITKMILKNNKGLKQ